MFDFFLMLIVNHHNYSKSINFYFLFFYFLILNRNILNIIKNCIGWKMGKNILVEWKLIKTHRKFGNFPKKIIIIKQVIMFIVKAFS